MMKFIKKDLLKILNENDNEINEMIYYITERKS